MNPMQLLQTFMGKGGNPMQFVMEAIGVNKNPMFDNLIKMAQKGDNKGVETFARNYFKGQRKRL